MDFNEVYWVLLWLLFRRFRLVLLGFIEVLLWFYMNFRELYWVLLLFSESIAFSWNCQDLAFVIPGGQRVLLGFYLALEGSQQVNYDSL